VHISYVTWINSILKLSLHKNTAYRAYRSLANEKIAPMVMHHRKTTITNLLTSVFRPSKSYSRRQY